MRSLIIASLLIASALCNVDLIAAREMVHNINSVQNQWRATNDNLFTGKSIEEVKSYLGTKLGSVNKTVPKVSYGNLLENAQIPTAFDGRTQFAGCIHPIRNQAHCGSCWAFGASEAFSDRLCIATKGATNVILSPQWLVSCDTNDSGCDGGYLSAAWSFIKKSGLVSDACVPYTSDKGDVQACPATCANGEALKTYKAKNVRSYSTINDAKLDIMTNGPIETGFEVYEDFKAYKSGVYKYTTGDFLGGHAIKVIGWGQENGVNYWIAANSWGEGWGENGFFRIQEGECSFENEFIAGDPVLANEKLNIF